MKRHSKQRLIHRGRPTRLAVAAVALMVGLACSDSGPTPFEPGRSDQTLRARGAVVTSIWQPDAQGSYSYLGTTRGEVSVDEGAYEDGSARTLRSVTLSDSEIETMRMGLPVVEAPGSDGPLADPSAQTAPLVRMQGSDVSGGARMRPITARLSDGREVRVLGTGNRAGGGPSTAYTVFVDGRLTMTKRVGYEKRGDQWHAVWSRSTSFKADGSIGLVADQDLSGLSVEAAMAGRLSSLLERAGDAACQLAGLVGPTPLNAAVVQEEGLINACKWQEAALALAMGYEAVALMAVANTAPACLIPTPATCGALAVALANLLVAQAGVALADAALQSCIDNYTPPPPPSDPDPIEREGGTTTNNDGSCTYVEWEISYNGGLSWHHLYTETVCSQDADWVP